MTKQFTCQTPPAFQGYADYLRSPGPWSPWCRVEGFHLKTAFHDPMHICFLGTFRDMYASSLGYWTRFNFFGTGKISERLLQFSGRMKLECKNERNLILISNSFLKPTIPPEYTTICFLSLRLSRKKGF